MSIPYGVYMARGPGGARERGVSAALAKVRENRRPHAGLPG
ncbi:hypothetical protein SBD_2873 [Streptomyces bottropensis ATCC 25435]|uniref:Uncharacterized protein n=1 Tax=Streptomyces bottropensis ATCC 25435 TaxID=1054862 RepID=M3FRF6_9ACTN|nr:hypothetical protein SBD_2873 [Streptomyces bottropensis ATCC 25435]